MEEAVVDGCGGSREGGDVCRGKEKGIIVRI